LLRYFSEGLQADTSPTRVSISTSEPETGFCFGFAAADLFLLKGFKLTGVCFGFRAAVALPAGF
jgi:hypothetical protein